MNGINRMFDSQAWHGLISLSPFALLFFLVTFWEPLLTNIPLKSELIVISGNTLTLGKKSASVVTPDGNVQVTYECLCNYGWGERSFDKGTHLYGLGALEGDTYKLWELELEGNQLFSYEEIASKRLDGRDTARSIAYPGIAISLFLSIFWVNQRINSRQKSKERDKLFALLDELADTAKPDSERLNYLSQVLAYKATDTVEALEIVAMNNCNSDTLLSAIGTELGRLWSEMELEEPEAIVYVQPAAKKSAIAAIQNQKQ